MKLKLIFILMDVLTVLVYPLVFVYGKIRQILKYRESIRSPHLSDTVSATPGS